MSKNNLITVIKKERHIDIALNIYVPEYDEETDEVVQAQFVGNQGMDSKIENLLSNNDGFVIIED